MITAIMELVSYCSILTAVSVLFSAIPVSEGKVNYFKRQFLFNFTYKEVSIARKIEDWSDDCAENILPPIDQYQAAAVLAIFNNEGEKKKAFSKIPDNGDALIYVTLFEDDDDDDDDEYYDDEDDYPDEDKKPTKPKFVDAAGNAFKYNVSNPSGVDPSELENYKCVKLRRQGNKELIERSQCSSKAALCVYKGIKCVREIPEKEKEAQGGKYFLLLTPEVHTYQELHDRCRQEKNGSGLAEINSKEDMIMIGAILKRVGVGMISLRKRENRYVNHDGKSPGYMKWGANQPVPYYDCVNVEKDVETKEFFFVSNVCELKVAICQRKIEEEKKEVESKKYFLLITPEVHTYQELHDRCRQEKDGAGLADINSPGDMTKIGAILGQTGIGMISLRRRGNKFVNHDGKSPGYMKWGANQPLSGYDCVNVVKDSETKDVFLVSNVCELKVAVCQRKDYKCKNASACAEHATCVDAGYLHYCSCPTGFIGDGHVKCHDVDECAAAAKDDDKKICDAHSDCRNTIGSFECKCKHPVWLGNGKPPSKCTLAKKCPLDNKCNKPNMYCLVLPRGIRCYCADGYHGIDNMNSSCVLLHVCKGGEFTCPLQSTCIKTSDSDYECRGNPGFKCDKEKCDDIDECQNKNAVCDPNAKCINKHGTFECVCELPYWIGNGKLPSQCTGTKKNICGRRPNACDTTIEICMNVRGGWRCKCKIGYDRPSLGSPCLLSKRTRCGTGNLTCPRHSTCENKDGRYDCNPNPGFKCDRNRCRDINECRQQLCAWNTMCVNTLGSYRCM